MNIESKKLVSLGQMSNSVRNPFQKLKVYVPELGRFVL